MVFRPWMPQIDATVASEFWRKPVAFQTELWFAQQTIDKWLKQCPNTWNNRSYWIREQIKLQVWKRLLELLWANWEVMCRGKRKSPHSTASRTFGPLSGVKRLSTTCMYQHVSYFPRCICVWFFNDVGHQDLQMTLNNNFGKKDQILPQVVWKSLSCVTYCMTILFVHDNHQPSINHHVTWWQNPSY